MCTSRLLKFGFVVGKAAGVGRHRAAVCFAVLSCSRQLERLNNMPVMGTSLEWIVPP